MIHFEINEQSVDFVSEKDLNVKLNRNFIDLQNIDSRSGDVSFTVKIPKNKTNNLIFSNINVQGVNDKFTKTEDYRTKLIVKGVNVIEGIFKLTSVDNDFYNGILLSNTIAWSKLLTGKNLNELINRDGSNWTFPYIGSSGDTAQHSLQWYIKNTDYDNSDVCFPLISYGNFWHGNNFGKLNYIYGDSLTFEDIPACPFQLKLVKKIFENIGWNVDSSLFSNPEHKKLYLPFTSNDQYGWNYETLVRAAGSGSSQTYVSDTTSETYHLYKPNPNPNHDKRSVFAWLYPSNNYYNPQGSLKNFAPFYNYYSVPVTTEHDINFSIKLHGGIDGQYYTGSNWVVPGGNFDKVKGVVLLYIETGIFSGIQNVMENVHDYLYNGSDITDPSIICAYDIYNQRFFQPFDIDADIVVIDNISRTTILPTADNTPWNFIINNGSEVFFEIRNLTLGSTEKIQSFFCMQGYGFPSPDILGNLFVIENVKWDFKASITGETDVNLTKNLPVISQLDFIKDWMVRHNLFFTADNLNKTIRFDTYDDFFLPLDFAYDITDKCDLNNNQPPAKPLNLPKNIFFRYNNDSNDALLKLDLGYGNLQVVTDNVYATGDKEINYLYSATKLREFQVSQLQLSTIHLPSLSDDSHYNNFDLTSIEWSFSTSPRILKTNAKYLNSTGGTKTINIDGYQTQILLSIFEDTREGYLNLHNAGDNGLYQQFYERYLNGLDRSHILNLNTKINPYDYSKMLPNVPILVNGEAFITNQINAFDPINPLSTKIELIKRFTN